MVILDIILVIIAIIIAVFIFVAALGVFAIAGTLAATLFICDILYSLVLGYILKRR